MKRTIRIIALVLTISICFSFVAFASNSVMPYSSAYLDSYTTKLSLISGTTKLQICFNVSGVRILDEIGTKKIVLQRSTNKTVWTTVKTFTPDQYPRMLGTETDYHAAYVEYIATRGYYYRAYITIWGGKDGGGDSRYVYTNIVNLIGSTGSP